MDPALEDLFAHEAWLRRLAVSIGGPDADDLLQDTWIAALLHPPGREQPVRPWLAQVLRNLARMRFRSATRRTARERDVVPEASPSPELLTERLQAQRHLAGMVLALDAPRREVVLLCYGQGLTSAQAAARLGIPAGTVRWRLKSALDELRRELGVEPAKPRGLWIFGKGFLAMKTVQVSVSVVVLLVCGLLVAPRLRHSGAPAAAAAAAPVAGGGRAIPKALPARATVDAPRAPAPSWFAQEGAKPRRLAGIVRIDGKPAAGARVRLTSALTDLGLAPILERATGADGGFDFGLQPAGRFVASAFAPGRSSRAVGVDLRGPARHRLEIDLDPCDATISGTVRDAAGEPIPTAQVGFTWDGLTFDVAADGSYELCGVAGETHTVAARAEGYGGTVGRVKLTGPARLDFTLAGEATVTGQVVRLSDGEPVAGARVHAHAVGLDDLQSVVGQAVTDSTGRFVLAGLRPGRMKVQAIGDRVVTTDYQEIVVAAGKPTEVQILVDALYKVRGTVRDGRGAPVASVVVEAGERYDQFESSSAVTQEDGSFVLGWVSAGEVKPVVVGRQVVSPTSLRVDRDLSGVELKVATGGRIAGRVVRGDRPVADAFVTAGRGIHAYTDDTGAFEIGGLDAGRYHVAAFGPRDHSERETIVIDLGPEEARTDLVLALEPAGGSIAGRVVDESGAPVGGAIVRWQEMVRYFHAEAVTGPDGAFRVAGLQPDGEYRARVSDAATGFALAPAAEFPRVRLTDGPALDQTLVVRAERGVIAGTVVAGGGAGVAGATVTLRRPDGATTTTASDGAGGFRLGGLPPGSYDVEARTEAGNAIVAGVAAGREDVVLTLGAPGRISGSVAGFSTAPAVRVQSTRPPLDMPPVTFDGKRYDVTGLLAGDYIVTAQAPNEQAVARVTLAAGQALELSLTAAGSATVAVTVVELGTGARIAGADCHTQPRAAGTLVVGAGGMASHGTTDARGQVGFAAPAGDLDVSCWIEGHSTGLAHVTAVAGQPVAAEITLVPAAPSIPPGFTLDAFVPGCRVADVTAGSAAAAAGLRPGDVLLAVDGVPTASLSRDGVMMLVAGHPAGTTVEVVTQRGPARLTLR